MTSDPFGAFKATQREAWSLFGPLEASSTIPAAQLVAFAGVAPSESVLDVGCGTGVVAVTAARSGARVRGLDLTPSLLERARRNASVACVEVDFVEGDAESLPYPDSTFDVVLSQFGHMFAPRPQVAATEMLRVLKPGGRVAFSAWPPDLFTGALMALIARYMPPPPPDAPSPAAPAQWGDPDIVRERLGERVRDLAFERGTMISPTLSPQHARAMIEVTLGPLTKLVSALQRHPERLAQLRAELDAMIREIFVDNSLRQHFLMSRAVKR